MLRELRKSAARSHVTARNGGSKGRNTDLGLHGELGVGLAARGNGREVCGGGGVYGGTKSFLPHPSTF